MTAITIPDSLGIAATVSLIMLLAARELAIAHGGVRLNLLGRYLKIAIIPLLFVFALIVVTKLIES